MTAQFADQKTIASFLDTAASRAECVNASPATRKQCWFLAKLIAEKKDRSALNEVVLDTSLVLTKSKASRMISDFLA